jgi:uncharacterized protein (DUF58 family)
VLTPRGVTLSIAGLVMWFAARLLGSPGLEVVGLGLLVAPFVAGFTVRQGPAGVTVSRRLSEGRVMPGARLTVSVTITNVTTSPTPLLLLEDQLPPSLGRPARLVVTDLRGRAERTVSYQIVPHARGHHRIGPLVIDATDAFGLARRRARLDVTDDLIVTPEVEDLTVPPEAGSGRGFGSARARQLLRSGEDYFTMRGYQEGDDLRRIHWPSVARTGELMIRQDEASRRAQGLLFVDNREPAIGRAHTPAFERGVSAAASVGMLLARNGFTLRLASSDAPAIAYAGDRFLDALAGLVETKIPNLGTAMTAVRSASSPETTFVFVGAPPAPQELGPLTRAAAGFGPKLAILVHPVDPETAPPSRREQLQTKATQASLTLLRAGWDCILLSPSMRLVDRWHTPAQEPRLASNA